jgi:hypothetical protein
LRDLDKPGEPISVAGTLPPFGMTVRIYDRCNEWVLSKHLNGLGTEGAMIQVVVCGTVHCGLDITVCHRRHCRRIRMAGLVPEADSPGESSRVKQSPVSCGGKCSSSVQTTDTTSCDALTCSLDDHGIDLILWNGRWELPEAPGRMNLSPRPSPHPLNKRSPHPLTSSTPDCGPFKKSCDPCKQ